MPRNISYPFTIYLRLFIQHIVPAGTQKALFLDVDTVVLHDLSNLLHLDLEGCVIGAVQDCRVTTFGNEWGGVLNYKELGISPDTKYFNTGLLLIDIPKWIAQNITQRVLDCVSENIKFANYPDQYGLNVVLADKWLPLDERWNYFSSGTLANPYLIHFVSRKPFYTSYNSNPAYKELFYKFLAQTEWHSAKPVGELRRAFKKAGNMLSKFK